MTRTSKSNEPPKKKTKYEQETQPAGFFLYEGGIVNDKKGQRIKHVRVKDGITKIDDDAFRSCKNLETVDMADSVTYIGDRALQNCSSDFSNFARWSHFNWT